MAARLYCPHCNTPLTAHKESRPGRCPDCFLIIGAGRARPAPDGEPRPGRFMANTAKRVDAAPVSKEAGWAALREAAAMLCVRVERMRMTDYDMLSRDGVIDVTVAELLATFPSWKVARAGARYDDRQPSDLSSQETRL